MPKRARKSYSARREAQLKAIANQIKADGGEAVYRVTDVTKPEDSAALVALAKEAFGKVDAIFLNAGLMPSSPLSALETANWNAMVDVNIKGVLNGIAAVLPEFNAQKSGHVITTSSVAGLKAYPGAAVYCGTKWAVKAIMESLRMESAQTGTNIRTATIYPAAVRSELVSHITDQVRVRRQATASCTTITKSPPSASPMWWPLRCRSRLTPISASSP